MLTINGQWIRRTGHGGRAVDHTAGASGVDSQANAASLLWFPGTTRPPRSKDSNPTQATSININQCNQSSFHYSA